MKKVQFTAAIHRFDKMGEKTGWTYFEVPADLANELKPGNRKIFKVKGKLDAHPIKRITLFPMGGGGFILVLNATLRKAIRKKHGAMVKVQLEVDDSEFVFNKDFMECLKDEPGAKEFFQCLPGSHQHYFSKWIDAAKTETTKTKRIVMAVNALAKQWDYGKMLRNSQGKE